MTRTATALIAACALAACVGTAPPPMVSDYNGHMVRVVYHDWPLGDDYRVSPIYAKAVEVCGSDASYQGMRRLGDGQGEHAFLCVKW